MLELYIYYQVSDANAPRLLALVQGMQASMATTHNVGTGLKRRPESEGGLQTWMEIYTGAGPAFSSALEDAATAAGVAGLVTGRRHTEVFTEMPPCA